jgi:beta-galactosidase
VARYKHPSWPAYAAMTRNTYGKGEVAYVGFMPSDAVIEKILAGEARRAGVEIPQARFPVIVRGGQLSNGRAVRYVLNYSAAPQRLAGGAGAGTDLLSGRKVEAGQPLDLAPWGVAIIEATGR